MCTIALLYGTTSIPLVIAANRDELYARPASGPQVLDPVARVVGGVDLRSGGTWLAVRADGQFAAVTNQRAMAPVTSGVRSRGHAVRELAAADDQDAYVAALDPREYASMNLVWGSAAGVSVAYVRHNEGIEVEPLAPGVHVLCNDRLGAPGFPRGVRLAGAIAAALDRSGSAGPRSTAGWRCGESIDRPWPQLTGELTAALADHTHAAEVPPSELSLEIARALTATCIHSPSYGTRSSTVLALDRGAVRSYLHADGPPCVTAYFEHVGLFA